MGEFEKVRAQGQGQGQGWGAVVLGLSEHSVCPENLAWWFCGAAPSSEILSLNLVTGRK